MHDMKSSLGTALLVGLLAFAGAYSLYLYNNANTFWQGVRKEMEQPEGTGKAGWLKQLEENQERIDGIMRQNVEDTEELFEH